MTALARNAHSHNSGINVMEAMKHFLVGFKARFTKQNSCLVPLTGPKTSGFLSLGRI